MLHSICIKPLKYLPHTTVKQHMASCKMRDFVVESKFTKEHKVEVRSLEQALFLLFYRIATNQTLFTGRPFPISDTSRKKTKQTFSEEWHLCGADLAALHGPHWMYVLTHRSRNCWLSALKTSGGTKRDCLASRVPIPTLKANFSNSQNTLM